MILGFDAKRFFHNKTGLGNYSRDLIRILAQYNSENNYLLKNKPKSGVKAIIIYPMNALINSQNDEITRYKKNYELVEKDNRLLFV